MNWPDLIRLALILVGCIGIGLALIISFPYAKKLTKSESPGGLLGWHILSISLSWVLLAVSSMWKSFSRLNDPWHPDFVIRFLGLILGTAAMIFLLKHLQVKHDDLNHRGLKSLTNLQAQLAVIKREGRLPK